MITSIFMCKPYSTSVLNMYNIIMILTSYMWCCIKSYRSIHVFLHFSV